MSAAEYQLLEPRYPKDSPVHYVQYDGREYYFHSYGDGTARLCHYELADGEEVGRLDTIDSDDIATPVTETLSENGIEVVDWL